MSKMRILVVDDEDSIRFGMRDFLEGRGYAVLEASSCQEAQAVFEASPPDAAVIDYRLHDGTAMDLLRSFKQLDADVPLVVLTAYGSIELAVQAVKEGAEHFLTKPIELPTLLTILQRLLNNRRLQRQQQAIESREQRDLLDPLAGNSPAIKALARQVKKVLAAESPILILGETGTGKTLLAKWLHRHGPRADEPFVDLNCAGLMPDFLETELFGHEKGAFTGATTNKKGMLEIANGGTVFLDEIGDVDARVQPKLLKVLEEQRFRRLGAVREREVNITLIAATHQDLATLVAEGTFRRDLYFRINSVPLALPALRERREDILPLAEAMLARLNPDPERRATLAADAEQALRDYKWPGNIRELRNVLERAALLCDDCIITRSDLRFETATAQTMRGESTNLTLQQIERQHIERVLQETDGKVAEAAVRLDVPRSTLYQKIKAYGIATSQRSRA